MVVSLARLEEEKTEFNCIHYPGRCHNGQMLVGHPVRTGASHPPTQYRLNLQPNRSESWRHCVIVWNAVCVLCGPRRFDVVDNVVFRFSGQNISDFLSTLVYIRRRTGRIWASVSHADGSARYLFNNLFRRPSKNGRRNTRILYTHRERERERLSYKCVMYMYTYVYVSFTTLLNACRRVYNVIYRMIFFNVLTWFTPIYSPVHNTYFIFIFV